VSAKAHFPRTFALLKRLQVWKSDIVSSEHVFTQIYQENGWDGTESVSGPGSTLTTTEQLRAELPALLRSVRAKSLVDAPCGDFYWMKELELGVDAYIGIDIVGSIVETNQRLYGNTARTFARLDITKDHIPKADVILCRDCLVHLSYKAVYATLRNFKHSGAKYLLTTFHSGTQENINIPTGGWRPLNLMLEPFNFPLPQLVIKDGPTGVAAETHDKNLGLWNLSDLALVGDTPWR